MLDEDFGVEILEENPYESLKDLHMQNIRNSGHEDLDVVPNMENVSFRVTSFDTYSIGKREYRGLHDYLEIMEGEKRAELKLRTGPSMNKMEDFREQLGVEVELPKNSFMKTYQYLTQDFTPRSVLVGCFGKARDDPVEAYENADLRITYRMKSGPKNVVASIVATDHGLESGLVNARPEDAKICYQLFDDLGIEYNEVIAGSKQDDTFLISDTRAEDILSR